MSGSVRVSNSSGIGAASVELTTTSIGSGTVANGSAAIGSSGSTGTSAAVGTATGDTTVSPSDVAARAKKLLAQVTSLQSQLGGSSSYTDDGSCPDFTRVLKVGSTGTDVAKMQAFLARDTSIYPEATLSGYFGALTQAAVQRFQAQSGVVASGTPDTTGYGMVGPKTAAAIVKACGGGSVSYSANSGPVSTDVPAGAVGGYIQVTPISGSAPLGVKVTATVNTPNSCTGANYVLDWGDRSALVQIPVAAGSCTQATQAFTHVYQGGGSFPVTLSAGTHKSSSVITVYGSSGSIVPGGGSAFNPFNPSPVTNTPNTTTNTTTTTTATTTTYGPLSMSQSSSNQYAMTAQFDLTGCPAFTLDWGDGSTPAVGTGGCPSGTNVQSFTHTYAAKGPFTVVLKRGSQTDTAVIYLSN